MAGTILINEHSAVALNSFGYHRMIEAVRAELAAADPSVVSAIYEGNDVACMNFISLTEQDASGFRAFLNAAISAHQKAANDGQTFPEWDELMVKLEADQRHAP